MYKVVFQVYFLFKIKDKTYNAGTNMQIIQTNDIITRISIYSNYAYTTQIFSIYIPTVYKYIL